MIKLKNILNEASLKGVEGLPSNKKLSQLSDNDKLKVLQSTGNLISFKVPDWSKGKRNFWTVISAGKIIKKKNLSGEIIFFLPGKGPEKASPTYPSIKDLLNGVDWDTMELRRESVNENSISPGSKEYFKPSMNDVELLELAKELTKYPVSRVKTPSEMQRFFKDVANMLGLPNQPLDIMSYDNTGVGRMDTGKIKMNASKALLFQMYKDKKLDMKTYGEIQKGLMEKYKQLAKKFISLLMFSRGAY